MDEEFAQGEYRQAVKFFKQKINVPTEDWRDLDGVMHSRAFAVAGAMTDEVLSDFRNAVDKAIASGSTLAEFRKTYDTIALKWSKDCETFEKKNAKPGYAAWRSKVIYSTNLAVAYSAGREEQMHNRVMKNIWTHAIYRTMGDGNVRTEHAVWNNVVLPMNDPWWSTHTPPCGWGCRCWKEPLSKEDMKREGLEQTPIPNTPKQDAKMIEAGWDHNPGMADRGNIKAIKLLYKQLGEKYTGKGWEPMPQRGYYKQNETPESPKPDSNTKTLKNPINSTEFKKELNSYLNIEEGDFKQLTIKDNKGFTFSYAINTEYLTEHLTRHEQTDWEGRSRHVKLIASTINDPQ
ncbi:MAG: phage head morphogenesis protein, partial [Fibromonadales bacterium]|nr:phage head morphogenesis protein [Fibromonadales bacterium]